MKTPELDEALTVVELVLDLGIEAAVGEQKDDPRSLSIFSAHSACFGAGLELLPFDLGENDGRGGGEHA